jgi:hypothetical protein
MTELSGRAAALRRELTGRGRTRTLAQVQAAFDRADPASRGSAQARALLADSLAELARAGVLTPYRTVEQRQRPPLPTGVRWNDQPPTTPKPMPNRRPWHPSLNAAATARLTPGQHRLLWAVSEWLFVGGGLRTNPELTLAERSLEVTGDEKAFIRNADLLTQFGLDPETLRCRRVIPPLHTIPTGSGTVALVVENMDTFESLRVALAAEPGPVGMVCWGAGAAFETSVRRLAQAPAPIEQIRYFGDLDDAGLRIPASAERNATAAGLPGVQPWYGLYQALYARGREAEAPRKLSPEQSNELAGWLPESLRERAVTLLCARKRLAQEAVHGDFLMRNSSWRVMDDPDG